jgi:hypothetical protein
MTRRLKKVPGLTAGQMPSGLWRVFKSDGYPVTYNSGRIREYPSQRVAEAYADYLALARTFAIPPSLNILTRTMTLPHMRESYRSQAIVGILVAHKHGLEWSPDRGIHERNKGGFV